MALAIRRDRTPASWRLWARRSGDTRAASRALAIAHALEGQSRAEAARLAGMERQALRDAVVRYNAEGVDGLSDRPRRRPSRLTEGQLAALRALSQPRPDAQPLTRPRWLDAVPVEHVVVHAAATEPFARAGLACRLVRIEENETLEIEVPADSEVTNLMAMIHPRGGRLRIERDGGAAEELLFYDKYAHYTRYVALPLQSPAVGRLRIAQLPGLPDVKRLKGEIDPGSRIGLLAFLLIRRTALPV